MKRKVTAFFKDIYTLIKRPEMSILPAHLAFYLMMMLVPVLVLLGTILTNFNISSGNITTIIYNNLPTNVANLIIDMSTSNIPFINLWIILIPAILLASNGTYSIIKVSNSIYKVNDKNYLKKKTKSFLMVIVLLMLFIFVLLVPTFGNLIFRVIGSIVTNTNVANSIYYQVFKLFKYPVSFFFIYLSVKFLYFMAPSIRLKTKELVAGSLFTSIMWVVSTLLYSHYIDLFTRYETFYGSMSSILFLMIWIYVLSYIFVLGMSLNSYNHLKKDKEKTN